LFSLNFFSQEINNEISLTIELNASSNESITLLATNNSASEIEMFPTIDGSYWCWTKPCIKFKIEEFINGSWEKIDYKFNQMRCGNYADWKKLRKTVLIPKGETKKIGWFKFSNNISGWFRFYGDKKIRLIAEYIIDGDVNILKKYGLKNMKLISKPLEIDYKNIKHPFDHYEFINQLLIKGELTKRKFKQAAKGIVFKGNKERRLEMALKKFSINIKNLHDKIVHYEIALKTTDKTNPVTIDHNVINDNGKGYLVLFIPYTAYGLEKRYSRDFCKVYEIN